MDQVETPARFNQQVLIFVFGLVGVLLTILLVYLIKRYMQMEDNEKDDIDIGQSRKHHDLTLQKTKEEEAAKKREAVEVHKMKKSISSCSSAKSSQLYSIVK